MVTSSPFKLTCMVWLPGVSHLIYLSILLRVSMFHLIKQFPHHITSEVIPSKLLIAIDNLNWNIHHDAILSKAYRTLGLVQGSFSSTIPT